jgi:PAS domain S-box-containing protein
MKMQDLSTREREIVLLAAGGLTDKEIAKDLGLTLASVRTYWERLRNKLGASNKSHAVALTLRNIVFTQEKAILEKDRWMQLIVESAEDFAMFAVDDDGQILSWNPGVERLLGYTEQEFLKMNCEEIFTPEDRAEGAPERERDTARRDGRALDERWHVRKDGKRLWGSGMMIQLRDEDGNRVGLAKILRDQSQIHDLQERLDQLGQPNVKRGSVR